MDSRYELFYSLGKDELASQIIFVVENLFA